LSFPQASPCVQQTARRIAKAGKAIEVPFLAIRDNSNSSKKAVENLSRSAAESSEQRSPHTHNYQI
jgi:hypothetical protein